MLFLYPQHSQDYWCSAGDEVGTEPRCSPSSHGHIRAGGPGGSLCRHLGSIPKLEVMGRALPAPHPSALGSHPKFPPFTLPLSPYPRCVPERGTVLVLCSRAGFIVPRTSCACFQHAPFLLVSDKSELFVCFQWLFFFFLNSSDYFLFFFSSSGPSQCSVQHLGGRWRWGGDEEKL